MQEATCGDTSWHVDVAWMSVMLADMAWAQPKHPFEGPTRCIMTRVHWELACSLGRSLSGALLLAA